MPNVMQPRAPRERKYKKFIPKYLCHLVKTQKVTDWAECIKREFSHKETPHSVLYYGSLVLTAIRNQEKVDKLVQVPYLLSVVTYNFEEWSDLQFKKLTDWVKDKDFVDPFDELFSKLYPNLSRPPGAKRAPFKPSYAFNQLPSAFDSDESGDEDEKKDSRPQSRVVMQQHKDRKRSFTPPGREWGGFQRHARATRGGEAKERDGFRGEERRALHFDPFAAGDGKPDTVKHEESASSHSLTNPVKINRRVSNLDIPPLRGSTEGWFWHPKDTPNDESGKAWADACGESDDDEDGSDGSDESDIDANGASGYYLLQNHSRRQGNSNTSNDIHHTSKTSRRDSVSTPNFDRRALFGNNPRKPPHAPELGTGGLMEAPAPPSSGLSAPPTRSHTRHISNHAFVDDSDMFGMDLDNEPGNDIQKSRKKKQQQAKTFRSLGTDMGAHSRQKHRYMHEHHYRESWHAAMTDGLKKLRALGL